MANIYFFEVWNHKGDKSFSYEVKADSIDEAMEFAKSENPTAHAVTIFNYDLFPVAFLSPANDLQKAAEPANFKELFSFMKFFVTNY